MSFTTSTSLPVTLGHVVSFLVTPLIAVRPLSTLLALQHILNTTLALHLKASWDEMNPLKGSGRRCLSLSPSCTPPRAIWAACIGAGIKWEEWIGALGGKEFDLFIDPGCVSVRILNSGRQSQMYTIWADEVPSPTEPQHRRPAYTFARAESPIERPNSRSSISSDSSCDSGYASGTSSMTAVSSTGSASSKNSTAISTSSSNTMSRRQRAMMRRMVIDNSQVAPKCYEGGRTTVLTGGTMLGAPKSRKAINDSWRRL